MIPSAIERAFAGHILAQSRIGNGGLYRVKSAEGAGLDLAVRRGHDERGELPQNGYIVCQCLQDTVQRVELSVNAYRVVATVTLDYPFDAYQGDSSSDDPSLNQPDPRNVPSFEYVCTELDSILAEGDDLLEALSAQETGVVFGCFTEGELERHEIQEGRQKLWMFPMIVMRSSYIPELQPVIA